MLAVGEEMKQKISTKNSEKQQVQVVKTVFCVQTQQVLERKSNSGWKMSQKNSFIKKTFVCLRGGGRGGCLFS